MCTVYVTDTFVPKNCLYLGPLMALPLRRYFRPVLTPMKWRKQEGEETSSESVGRLYFNRYINITQLTETLNWQNNHCLKIRY